MRRLTEDAGVCLSKPATQFGKSERKRAHTAALYYSECFHRGIEPLDAENAAQDAQDMYDKWWIERTAKCRKAVSAVAQSGPEQSTLKDRRLTVRETCWESAVTVASINGADAQHSAQLFGAENSPTAGLGDRGRLDFDAQNEGEVAEAKARLIQDLKDSGGNVETQTFVSNMEILEAYYRSTSWDGSRSSKESPCSLEGNWLTISRPTYDECLGRNGKGDLVYTLGRMSFGMFRPTKLICSVQASFNTVRTIDPKQPDRPLHVPKKLLAEICTGKILLRTYDIVVAITIEPGQNRMGVKRNGGAEDDEYVVPRPITGILTNQAYVVPDPSVLNRLSIWFSGGDLEVQDEPSDLEEWLKVFDSKSTPDRSLRECASALAARVILGALLPEEIEDDGKMSFELRRPMGGHGQAYCDIVYMDNDLRIMRGHLGSVYVCTRIPVSTQSSEAR